jgi:hypothetical protein
MMLPPRPDYINDETTARLWRRAESSIDDWEASAKVLPWAVTVLCAVSFIAGYLVRGWV